MPVADVRPHVKLAAALAAKGNAVVLKAHEGDTGQMPDFAGFAIALGDAIADPFAWLPGRVRRL
ncbi:hypothetical protein M8756_14655 [Lutimaribacter sp. EGI FJ00015]|nr:hypothetical protein [Lutimaribacter sp. EGI FJ00015]